MPPIYSLYIGLLIATLFVSVLLFFLALKYRASGVVQAYLLIVFLGCGIETVVLLSLYSPNAAWAVWWHGNLRFTMLGLISPLAFLFVSVLLEPSRGLFRNSPWWLLPIPVLTAFLSLTNDWHHWVFRDYRMFNEFGLFLRATWNPGPWFYVHLANSFAISLLILLLLLRLLRKTRRLPRFRGTLAVGVVLIGFMTSALDVFGLAPAPGLLWAPIGLGLIDIVIMMGVIYLDLFDVLPVARETLFNYMTDIVLILDADDHVVEINPAGERALQVKLEAFRGWPVYYSVDLVDVSLIDDARNILSQTQYRGETSLVISQKVHQFDVIINAIYLEEGILGAKLVVMRDITQQKELQQRERELATFEERQRLARDLHDAVSQTLFSARLASEILLRQKDELAPAILWENIQQITRLITSALSEMRILLLELRPNGLANTVLPVLLTHLAEATGARTTANLRCSLHGEGQLPVDVKIAFYRIAQEALNNSVKYAHASEINLDLVQGDTSVKLTITDNGRGFIVSNLESDHFGISIMRERAAEIGARLEIISQPDAGACVICDWQE
jgi:signal transduction histidine kinase